MAVQDIHWHDSLILWVKSVPEKDTLEMRLLYPEDWRMDGFAERSAIFEGAYGYKEFEGPFFGSPTILSADIVETHEQWNLVRLQTNAGHREIYCKDVFLHERKVQNR
jgi:hypothetical protein